MVFDVFYPVGRGTERVEDLCQLISDSFESTSSVENGGVLVGIDKTERSPGLKVDNVWYMASVSIYWRTYRESTPIDLKL